MKEWKCMSNHSTIANPFPPDVILAFLHPYITCHTLRTTSPNPVFHPKNLNQNAQLLSPTLPWTCRYYWYGQQPERKRAVNEIIGKKPAFLFPTEIPSLLSLFLQALRLRQLPPCPDDMHKSVNYKLLAQSAADCSSVMITPLLAHLP